MTSTIGHLIKLLLGAFGVLRACFCRAPAAFGAERRDAAVCLAPVRVVCARGFSDRGITLLELVLVMVIICAVLSLAAPSLSGFFGSRRTADSAARILALAQYARAQSAADAAVYRLHVDADEAMYWIERSEYGEFVRLNTEFGREFALPEGTTAIWDEQPGDPPRQYIEFQPDGRTEAASLRLTGRRAEVFDVVCHSATERFRCIAPLESER